MFLTGIDSTGQNMACGCGCAAVYMFHIVPIMNSVGHDRKQETQTSEVLFETTTLYVVLPQKLAKNMNFPGHSLSKRKPQANTSLHSLPMERDIRVQWLEFVFF